MAGTSALWCRRFTSTDVDALWVSTSAVDSGSRCVQKGTRVRAAPVPGSREPQREIKKTGSRCGQAQSLCDCSLTADRLSRCRKGCSATCRTKRYDSCLRL